MLALVCGALLLGVSSAAHAEEVWRDDVRGDAPAAIDARGARYTHGENRVTVVAKLPKLGGVGQAALSISRFTIFEAGYVALITKQAGEKPRVRLTFFDHFKLNPAKCSSISGAWGDGRIKLSVARTCLLGHAREMIYVRFGIQRGSKVDRVPAVEQLARS